MNPIEKLLAEELVRQGLVRPEDMDKCVAEAKARGESVSSHLVRDGYVSEQQVLGVLADSFKIGIVDLHRFKIEPSVLERIPVKFAAYYKFMPLKIEDKILTLASPVPLDVKTQDEIRVHLGLEPKVLLAKEKDVAEALKRHYGVGAETIDKILAKEPSAARRDQEESAIWVEDLERESEDVSVSKLVNQIFLDAVQKRATDIHIEPYREKMRVRYRIDGVLMDAHLPSEGRHFLRPILSRIKIMANLSIEEKRLPQDGSAIIKTKDQDLDLRISTIPTPRGESIVIRILPAKVMLYSLEKLGLDSKNLKVFRDLIRRPYGIILVSGPTGSGKTTTLYACLHEINSTKVKIITIEDPIEYEMEGITQIHVNPKVNLDFARGLRSILRHDPNIIMVGEIRDFETAEIAIRTALTGHLVFSTLHTNDATGGITRLIDMGVEPFLVASSIEAFVAQRLVRLICPQCKLETQSPLLELREEMASALHREDPQAIKIYHGRGCDHCNQTGYFGRTAIYEILVMNEDIRAMILAKRRAEDIKRIAMERGMTTLRQEGWRKVMAGLTTPEEILNVTTKEEYPSIPQDKSLKNFREQPEVAPLAATSLQSRRNFSGNLSVANEYDSRIYPRLVEKIPVRFQFMKKDPADANFLIADGIEHAAFTKDISAGGLRFIYNSTIALGTILNLKILLQEGERSIECLSKVCRMEEDHRVYHIVVYYLDITSADRAKINQFVKSKLEKA